MKKSTINFYREEDHEVALICVDGVPKTAAFVKAGDPIGTTERGIDLLRLKITGHESTREAFIGEINLTLPHDEDCTCKEEMLTLIKLDEACESIEKVLNKDTNKVKPFGVDGPTNIGKIL